MVLYKLINELGVYWVLANDPSEAVNKLNKRLNDSDYGFSSKRHVKEIHVIAEDITEGSLGISGKFLLL